MSPTEADEFRYRRLLTRATVQGHLKAMQSLRDNLILEPGRDLDTAQAQH